MIFAYRPVRLMEWVEKEVKEKSSDKLSLKEDRKNLSLDILRETLLKMMKRPHVEFESWTKWLTAREKNMLPFLFVELETKEQKEVVVKELLKLAATSRQLFKNCLDLYYHTEYSYPYWVLAKVSYQNNRTRIIKRWSNEQIQEWDQFLKQKDRQEKYIVQNIISTDKPIREVCSLYNLKDSHSFYKKVAFHAFESANLNFFHREKELFINLFSRESNDNQQRLAAPFIISDALNEMEDVSKLIYERMSTYMRKPQLWANMEVELKKKFHSWAMLQNIREFFTGIDKDHERFQYWEKFIPKMENAVVLKKERTVLFYFNDVVIMEILGTGAVYIYKRDYFDNRWGARVDAFLESEERANILGEYYNPTKLTRLSLMDRDNIYKEGWLRHNGDWQIKFDDFLRDSLNWEVNKDEILQQSKNHFTI